MKTRIVIVAGLILTNFFVNFAVATQEKLVIAHRGASGYLPEHTLEAKALAYGMGADYIEQDLVLTKDDVPIVIHDIHLETTTDVVEKFPGRAREDGKFYAIDFSLAEIKRLRVNERIRSGSGKAVFPERFPLGLSSFRVPTLAEEIELIQGLNRSSGKNIGIYPEIKSPGWHRSQGKDISKIVLKILKKYGYADQSSLAYLQCFDPDELKRIRYELNSQLKLVQLLGENRWGQDYANINYAHLQTKEGLAEIAQYANGVGPWMQQVLKGKGEDQFKISSLVKEAHAAGLVVHPYTFRADALPKYVTSLEQLLKIFYFDLGVDGVFTDFPDRAVKYLDQKN
ncbi:MAG: glycerophosphodiester phosphodiesterase [SAR324 cluster bacterium]|nr:glycerophosphodiester phosphodiesterase [SAR324 cluster bacterium]